MSDQATGAPRSLFAHEPANRSTLRLLIQLRWIAGLGQVVTLLVAQIWFSIRLPIAPMGAVLVFLLALNLVSIWHYRRRRTVPNQTLLLELLLDVSALTLQLYLSGGATNPFIWLYLLQVGLGAVVLEARSAWILAAVTGLCFVTLTFIHRPLLLPPGTGENIFSLYLKGMFVCFILTASLLVLCLSRIRLNLRDHERHLADLRRKSEEEDHIVRLGLLTSGAAHELGTPLSTLCVILNDWSRLPLVAGDPDLTGELTEMQGQIERCKTIVSGILLSCGEARGDGTRRTTACAFFDEIVEEWQASRGPAQLDYRNLLRTPTPIVSDLALKQVVFNVFDNALEASPEWVGVTVEEADGDLVVAVRDAGPGFAPAMLEDYGRPYRSTKTKAGSGLGLFLVVNVIRKLGGRVRVCNEVNGALVALAFPLSALSWDDADGR